VGSGDVSPEAYVKNEVWLQFADGDYLFKLKLPQLAELQEKCGAGIGSIYMRVLIGEYKAEDLIETIRLGLVGGQQGQVNDQDIKVSDITARKLVQRYCDRPLDELHKLATAILSACVVGYAPEDKKPGKAQAETTDPELDGLTSPPHMPTE
jgi:hypothetical protein